MMTVKSANRANYSNDLNYTLNGTIDEAKSLRQLKLQALKVSFQFSLKCD